MNNLPIWIGVWSANNYANSGAELTSVESTVIWVIIAIITLATIAFGYWTLKY